jgi:hypothetical protein
MYQLTNENIFGNQKVSSVAYIRWFSSLFSNGDKDLQVGTLKITTGTSYPTSGTWPVGSVCFNTSPSIGTPTAWTCTVAGNPGTWRAWANL